MPPSETELPVPDAANTSEPVKPTKPLRLKTPSSKRRKLDEKSHDRLSAEPSSHGRTHRTHKHHRHHRQHRTRSSPSFDLPSSAPQLDTDTAFRESLFDALADDEGAAYWEGVYGQPIHIYPSARADGTTGELERMSDDEYIAYVRTKMWEKTHQGLLEERRLREEAARRRKEETARAREEERRWRATADSLHADVEDSLRRGRERRAEKMWKEAWNRYLKKWEAIGRGEQSGGTRQEDDVPWPTKGGGMEDIDKGEVEKFFRIGVNHDEEELRKILKIERVRWHPDKMMQRFGGSGDGGRLKEPVLRNITAVFQVVDEIFNRIRAKKA